MAETPPAPLIEYLCVDRFLGTVIDTVALHTAFTSGLLDYLRARPHASAREIDELLHAHPWGARLLIDLLRANGVVERAGEHVALTEGFRSALRFQELLEVKIELARLAAADVIDDFSRLVTRPFDFMRRSRMISAFDSGRAEAPSAAERSAARRWMRFTTALTRHEAEVCLHYHDFGHHVRMLDIGGNSGEFALRACRRHPALHASVLDLPVVCEVGAEHVRGEPEAERIAFLPGNALHDPLPPDHDLITFKSMLHDLPDAQMRQLLERASGALHAGGTLLVFERAPLEIGASAPPCSLLPMLLFGHTFRAPSVYVDALRSLGFSDVTLREIALEMPFFLIVARSD